MNHLAHNRNAWNVGAVAGGVWSSPVDAQTIARARVGDWQVILTPKLPVPRDWFGELVGRDVLCLASAGGQQVPILAAAGASVVSFDLSDEQLSRDAAVCAREGLHVRCLQGDMADLGRFAEATFDLIFHPAANVFVPDLEPVWRGCFRILKPGGSLLAGFMNPAVFLFDHQQADATGTLVVKHRLPYADTTHLPSSDLEKKIAQQEPLEFSHSLDAQIGGQLRAGFLLAGFYEDHWFDHTWLLSEYTPIAMATRAIRPK